MRVKVILLLMFSLFVATELAAQSSADDLIYRVKAIDKEAYLMAIEDSNRLDGALESDNAWQSALEQIVGEREAIIKGIGEGDAMAEKSAETLLAILDGRLLKNPLLKDKEIMVVRRNFEDGSRERIGGQIGIAPTNYTNNSAIQYPLNGWDNEFVKISGFGKKLKEKVIYRPEGGRIAGDIEPHFSGEKLMFSSIGTHDRWHLFELDIASGQARQLTPESYIEFDSFDGCYTPDGRYIFCATATFLGLPCTDGYDKMCGIFVYDPATGETRQLTFDQDSNWNPTIMNNGQVLYQRWEYSDIPHSNSRYIFTMNPDGTSQLAYYGRGSYFPAALFGTRQIPGHSSAFVGIAGGHHSVSRSGQLLVIDPSIGRTEADGVVAEIPYRGRKVEPVVRDRQSDGIWPQFLDPFPLNENYFLVTMKRNAQSLWGVYLVDRFNNITLISQKEGSAILEPVVMQQRDVPPVIPERIDRDSKRATVFIQDIYFGGGLKDIPRGTVKKLRIGSYCFSPLLQGGLLGTIGAEGPWDIKRICGEVDVNEDGSVMFEIPANRPIFVQPLDEDGKALQLMRSWFTAMPGEVLSCVGCHEDRNQLPLPKATMASRKGPQKVEPFFGAERGFSYRHEIQPILDAKCVQCHNGNKSDRPYLKGDLRLTDWSSDIQGRARSEYGGDFTESYYQLQRYVRRPGIESDIAMLAPMDVHADQTELMQILNKGHYGVELDRDEIRRLACWIDFNAPFHGRRSDLKGYERTKNSYETRKGHLEMLNLDWVDVEWLPEIPTDVAPVKAAPLAPITGDLDSLEGWPRYRPENLSRYEAPDQVALQQIRRSIALPGGGKIDLVKVPSGSFIMGSKSNRDERPTSQQSIEKPFWIGSYEITNEQFAQFDAEHDSRTEHRHGYQFGQIGYPLNHDRQPVVRVTWERAMAFCEWLSELTGLKVSLPTEAQWEWAARAGSDTPYYFGDFGVDFSKYANLGDMTLQEFAACSTHKFYESIRIIENPNRYDDWIPRDTLYSDRALVSDNVGSYRPNPWDIYDMSGNVSEWTRSAYRAYPYSDGDGRNDLELKEKRVVRGGSWYDRPFKATSSYRSAYQPYQGLYNVGFRIVIEEE